MSETKENENMGVTVKNQFTQADIPDLLTTVNKKIKELTGNNAKVAVITQPLPGFSDIHKTDSILTLLQACGSVEGKSESYAKMATKYLPEGSKAPVFKIEGYTTEEWLAYLSDKISQLIHKKELQKLKSIKETLESNLSQEMKLANDLKKISELLGEE